MSFSTVVTASGTVIDLASRTVKRTTGPLVGQDITFHSMVLVDLTGKTGTRAEIGYNPERFTPPKLGDVVHAKVAVSTYRDDDQLELVGYLA